jgi:hypothetical protein
MDKEAIKMANYKVEYKNKKTKIINNLQLFALSKKDKESINIIYILDNNNKIIDIVYMNKENN